MIKSINLDKLAIFLSSVCVIHCLIAPILVTLLPIFALNAFVTDDLFHQLMLWLVLPTSSLALFIGCRKHRDLLIGLLGTAGMLILIIVAFFGHETFGDVGERIATSIGGIILAISHFMNHRACQKRICDDDECANNHHH